MIKRSEPYGFMLKLGIGSSILLFFFVFMVFIRKALYSMPEYKLPVTFYVSTLLILISSLALVLARKYLTSDEFIRYRQMLFLSFIAGTLFIISQVFAWQELIGTVSKNDGLAFVFILSGLHLLHTLGGLVALGWVWLKVQKKKSYVDAFIHNVNPPNVLMLNLVSFYWHFVDILWICIFLFLLFYAA